MNHSLAALAATVAAPVALIAVALRSDWRRGIGQRLGRVSRAPAGGVWVHASSVGEARAAAPLLEVLQGEGRPVFASTSTLAGRGVLQRHLPGVPCSLAPVDHPWCVEWALSRVRPELLVLVETEIWPSLIAVAKRRGIGVAVVSGRLSDRSFPRYRRLRRFLTPTLLRLDAVGARSALDAERFAELGVPRERIEVTGDLKREVGKVAAILSPDLGKALPDIPIFVAGSTHPGEEGVAPAVLERCRREGLEVVAVVAPRRLGGVVAIERRLAGAGVTVRRRSLLGCSPPLRAGEVLLLDTLGELPAVYGVAAAAFVGGTLVSVGGHNLLEPVLASCPVVFGPHVENVREQADLAVRTGAGVCADDAEEVAAAAVQLLRDPAAGRTRAERGRRALEGQRGSLARSLELVTRVLAARNAA